MPIDPLRSRAQIASCAAALVYRQQIAFRYAWQEACFQLPPTWRASARCRRPTAPSRPSSPMRLRSEGAPPSQGHSRKATTIPVMTSACGTGSPPNPAAAPLRATTPKNRNTPPPNRRPSILSERCRSGPGQQLWHRRRHVRFHEGPVHRRWQWRTARQWASVTDDPPRDCKLGDVIAASVGVLPPALATTNDQSAATAKVPK